MKKPDRELGMGADISRRDFIHDAGLAVMGLSLPLSSIAAGSSEPTAPYYPPTRTGLRGSHPGSFEVAHALAREGKSFESPQDLQEQYDLVVVGAGISGLAAAYYYREKFGQDARILILDNHDDFGGHAKRNEFHQSGEMRLSMGGTHNLEHWKFSDTVNALMDELGVDTEAMLRNKEFQYGRNGSHDPAIWFDADTYGRDKLVTDCNLMRGNSAPMSACIDQFPISEVAREQLRAFYAMRTNVFEGMSEEDVSGLLGSIGYMEFLRKYGGLGDEATQLYGNACHTSWGVETRSLSAGEAFSDGLPGRNLLGNENHSGGWDYPVAMFPDGNASIARLLVQALIPAVAPGTNADNIALAKFDYSQLDHPGSSVRLRLNSTVTNAGNTDEGVAVTYIRDGQPLRVSSKHSVLACYHVVIPHLCPDLPEEQKTAQQYQVKRPLLQTSVLIRSSESMDKLGITGARCPGRMHARVFMFKGINTGGYRHEFADDGPLPMVFFGSIAPPREVIDLKEQMRASRAKMLALSFEDYEREIRTVLDGMLGPTGFNVKNDILAITVNRWPHGYSHDYLDLWDPDWPEGQAPHLIASRPWLSMRPGARFRNYPSFGRKV
jgi:spermidine dehydrogenase